MRKTLADILEEADQASCPGALADKYDAFLQAFFKKPNHIKVIGRSFSSALKRNQFRRLELLTALLIEYGGDNSSEQQNIYLEMMHFICTHIKNPPDTNDQKARVLTDVLDLFWHQDGPLKNLDQPGQLLLHQMLQIVATFDFERTNIGEEIFFAVNKSMDLIKFQQKHGDSKKLIQLYLTHANSYVKQRAMEYNENGWLE